MGQTLSVPETKKKSESGGNDHLLYAISEMQGWRITMEDAHTAVLDLDGATNSNAFFAVYDGHGGGRVSKYAGEYLHKRLLMEETYHEKRYDAALKRAFLGTDEDLLATRERETSGATAVTALMTTDNKIYVANAGDSRSVIGVKGEVKPLSYDHKPTNESEKARICAAGGYIDYGRVNGNLALSRALGDFEFKKNSALSPEQQIITADPDVICHEVTDEDEFLVLACDGIWDCLTSQQVIDFIRYEISQGKDLTEITEMICDYCLAPDTGSRVGIGCDNMTVLLVAILHGRTKEEWYSWITDRVNNHYGYDTPSTHPQLYSLSRIMSFRARQETLMVQERSRQEEPASLAGIGRILGSTGGISFSPASRIFIDDGPLMFSGEDNDDDEQREEMPGGHISFNDDRTTQLRAQLDEFEHSEGESHEPDEVPLPAGDLPAAKHLINGDLKSYVTPVEQLEPRLDGDAPPSVAKIEGFLDSSEDPLKI
ncbi:hypothetical protein APHAL10511_002608 [Amanita phalloides]|nr:hypothetical protein APHAL10511_002608 [Amanita phalloides]